MSDPDDIDGLARWARIYNKSHGYGGVFNLETPEDKAIVELSTAQEWCISMATELGHLVGEPILNPNDPPDCYVDFEGQRLSIELVQLIDQRHKHRATKSETPYAGQLFMDMQWSQPRFEAALTEIVKKKGAKYQNRELNIDALVIHTDEPWLYSWQARVWLETFEFQAHPNISSAYLLFNYEPGRDVECWPVLQLYGNLPGTRPNS